MPKIDIPEKCECCGGDFGNVSKFAYRDFVCISCYSVIATHQDNPGEVRRIATWMESRITEGL